tara:strand:+ start:1966 stop:2685 length:720 start_codon:yes stop_codon:yes gene_type:complete
MQIAIHGILAASASAVASFSNTKSLEFDGVDDFVDFGNPTSLQITGDLTISAWLKTSMSNTGFVISKDALHSGRNYALVVVDVSGTLRARFFIVKSNSLVNVTSTTIDVGDNNWHHIVGINDGSNLKIYVDGNLEATNAGAGGTIDNDSVDFEIGRRGDNNQFYNGHIDEVAVWNSDQSSNVATIYNSGSPADLTSLSPVSWWRNGDGDTFPTLTDNGSGSNNGTMTNMTSGDIVTDVP